MVGAFVNLVTTIAPLPVHQEQPVQTMNTVRPAPVGTICLILTAMVLVPAPLVTTVAVLLAPNLPLLLITAQAALQGITFWTRIKTEKDFVWTAMRIVPPLAQHQMSPNSIIVPNAILDIS